jgi:MFS family permease
VADGGGGGRLLADLRPLRESAAYRRLWIGQTLSGIGAQVTAVAVPIQIYGETHSSLAVGLTGLASGIPLVAVGLLGGLIADRVERRGLVLITSSLLSLASVGLLAQAWLGLRSTLLLYALVAAQSCLFGLDAPARRTFTPRLLRPESLLAASALNQFSFQGGVMLGPLLAGFLVAWAGLPVAYLFDVLSFAAAIWGVFGLPRMRPDGETRPGLREALDGFRFVASTPIMAAMALTDVAAMLFGMPRALFPALAALRFGGGASTVGMLYAAIAVGGFSASVFSGPLARVRRQGAVVALAAGLWGLAAALFALTTSLPLALALLAVAGAFDLVSVVLRQTIQLVLTPDALRGRVGAFGFAAGSVGPRLGDVESGLVASLSTPEFSAVSGGIACIVCVALLAWRLPSIRSYRAS